MILGRVFSPKGIILNLESEDKDELFEEMIQTVLEVQPAINRDEALEALRVRESKMTTGIMHEIAVPHCNCSSVKDCVGVIGVSRKGVDYDSLDGAPVKYVFMMLCNPSDTETHLEVLKELAAVLQNPAFINEMSEKHSSQDVYDLLCQYEASLAG